MITDQFPGTVKIPDTSMTFPDTHHK